VDTQVLSTQEEPTMPKSISNKPRPYSHQFKKMAVLLSEHPDILIKSVAERLDIHPTMLYRWRLEMKKGDIPDRPDDDLPTETDLLKANQKIKRLEDKLKKTEMERDFLKKLERFSEELKKRDSTS